MYTLKLCVVEYMNLGPHGDCTIMQYRFTVNFCYLCVKNDGLAVASKFMTQSTKKCKTINFSTLTIIINNHYFNLLKASISLSAGKGWAANGWSDRQLEYLLVLWCIILNNLVGKECVGLMW